MNRAAALSVLRRLGLEELEPTPIPAPEPPPRSETGQGLTAATLAQLRDAPAAALFDPVALPELEDAGFLLFRHRTHPAIVKVSGPGAGLRVRVEAESPHVLPCEENEAVLIDTARAPAVAVLAPTGNDGVLIEGGELAVLEERIPLPPEASVASDAIAWARVSADPWLLAEVEPYAADPGPLAQAIAAGIVARLAPPPASRAEKQAAVEALLAGRPMPELYPERTWALGLGHDQRATIERHALAAADFIGEELERLARDPEPGDPGYRAELRAARRMRDDLEGVRILLAVGGGGARLAAALADLDERAEIIVRSLPAPAREGDERLRRAAQVNPEGWWTLDPEPPV
jgi:hypothetical protein